MRYFKKPRPASSDAQPFEVREPYRELKRKHAIRLLLTYLAPLLILTAYFHVQQSAIVEEGQRLHMKAVAEGQGNTLDLFLAERLENLSNLIDELVSGQPSAFREMEAHLGELRRDSPAFVDLGFIDSRGVLVAYAGPYPSLREQNYGGELWFTKLRRDAASHVITDVYLGLRQRPHVTVAVKRVLAGEPCFLKASLDPERILEHISSWGGIEDVRTSIVNKDGFRQLVTPGTANLMEHSPIIPPATPRIGTDEAEIGGEAITFAYYWLRVVDWALIVQPHPSERKGLLSGLGTRIVAVAGLIVVIGIGAVMAGAGRLARLQMESDEIRAQLAERAKELAGLFQISRLLETPRVSLDEILQTTVQILREAWQYPDIAAARITVDGRQYTGGPWEETEWRQSSDLVVNQKKVGSLEVCYREPRPESYEGPFLKEERHLIDAVAGRLGLSIERRRAAERQGLLTTAIEHAAESFIITDTTGRIEYVNPAFSKITGYSREEVIGKNPRILKSGKHDETFYKRLWQTILGGRTWEGRFINKRKDGTLFEVDCRISPVRDDSGKITNFVAVKHDVTEMLKLEDNLRQAQKMEAVGQLAGGVAHDFNNILTVILTNAHYLQKAVDASSPLGQDIEEIRQAGERAASLTRQLLAFSRQQVLEPRVMDLNQVLAGTEKMLRRLIGEDIELKTEPGDGLDLVYEDPSQVEQVILNLAVNARDAMPNGGRLTLETANVLLDGSRDRLPDGVEEGPYVMLKVTDTGCGMDGATRQRIFEPFFTTKEHGKGTGLGLATVYGIVAQGGGHIAVESEVDKGSTFRVYFRSVTMKRPPETARYRPDGSLEGSETILLVEDDEPVRQTAARVLRDYGYTVIEARDGKAALAICRSRSGKIDLLMTDVVMPEMSGGALAELLTEAHPSTRVLFMSGYAKGETQGNHGAAADHVFIQKPLIPDELARRVREILDRR